MPAEAIVDRWDYDMRTRKFLGDAFPCAWLNFGPGVLATFLGARLENTADTAWYHPPGIKDIRDLHFELNPDDVWFRRISDIYRACVDRWQGEVQIAMTDLGGNLDILSTFRPSERLLLDLYDHPDEVKRLTWEAHECWFQAFEAFNAILQPSNPGYTAWTPIYSEDPYYMLQCDFCYMIGPDMFDEFVKPELAATCQRLGNPFYHLDGPGELPHLDSLLAIDELKGVQWVPGDGAPPQREWPQVYRKIREAGKLIQLLDIHDTLDPIAEALGSARGIIAIGGMPIEQEQEARALLERHGVPA